MMDFAFTLSIGTLRGGDRRPFGVKGNHVGDGQAHENAGSSGVVAVVQEYPS